jgi:aspartate-semialdehyde dehydrogenase
MIFAGRQIPCGSLGFPPRRTRLRVLLGRHGRGASMGAGGRVERGATVIDNSYAFRMGPACPWCPGERAPARGSPKLIANPNCSTVARPRAGPLARHAGLERVVVSTYQSVSGTGRGSRRAGAQVEGGRAARSLRRPSTRIPSFNCVPQVDDFVEGGYTREAEAGGRDAEDPGASLASTHGDDGAGAGAGRP